MRRIIANQTLEIDAMKNAISKTGAAFVFLIRSRRSPPTWRTRVTAAVRTTMGL